MHEAGERANSMLFVIDVGNTNVVMGIYRQDRLIGNWRIRTERNITEDEFFILCTSLFERNRISSAEIEMTVVSCVVPPMMYTIEMFCRKYLNRPPHWVDGRTVTIMPILVKNPVEVGADRIVNAIAAYHKYQTSLIVIDFGTATTFDAVSGKGELLGCAISPGIRIAAEALFEKASKLQRVEFTPPESVIGKDTASSMKSGIIFGYGALVDGMVRRMKKEMESDPRVIATGGLAPLMDKVSETIEVVEPNLTLEGLRIIAEQF
jgi:type III pantothenate kinase